MATSNDDPDRMAYGNRMALESSKLAVVKQDSAATDLSNQLEAQQELKPLVRRSLSQRK